MKELQEWAGHSSYNTTANIYAHIQEESKKEKPLKSNEINDFRLYGGRGWIRFSAEKPPRGSDSPQNCHSLPLTSNPPDAIKNHTANTV